VCATIVTEVRWTSSISARFLREYERVGTRQIPRPQQSTTKTVVNFIAVRAVMRQSARRIRRFARIHHRLNCAGCCSPYWRCGLVAAGGGVGAGALASIPHFVSWKIAQLPGPPEASAALYFALHSSIVSALADVLHKHNTVTVTRLRIIMELSFS
jgi:hypothetical protein